MEPQTNTRFIQASCLCILAGLTTACASHMTPIEPFGGKTRVIPADAGITEPRLTSQSSNVTRLEDSRNTSNLKNAGSTVHAIDLNGAIPKAILVSSKPKSTQFQRFGDNAWLLPKRG